MISIPVIDTSHIAAARREAVAVSESIGFDEQARARVALIVTELATNLVKHARAGSILVANDEQADAGSLQLLALDRGSGMANVQQFLEDGYSTSGSPGTGLGAILRQAHDFEIMSQPEIGTAIYVRVGSARAEPGRIPAGERNHPRTIGVVCLPKSGETANGDAWAVSNSAAGRTFLVVDGLGHGFAAAEASSAAVRVFRERIELAPAEMLAAIHEALRPTRGAALAVARIEAQRDQLVFAGIGNIAGAVITGTAVRKTVSRNGTAGHQLHRIHQYEYPFEPGSQLIMHSDGLSSKWVLDRYPGLMVRHPLLIAGVLWRDYGRERDDATVLVAARE